MEPVAKSTLVDAMNRCNPSIFNDLFKELLDRYTKLAPGHGFRFPPIRHRQYDHPALPFRVRLGTLPGG